MINYYFSSFLSLSRAYAELLPLISSQIPTDIHPTTKKSSLETVLTVFHIKIVLVE
jgi:hypothetical protein